MEPFYKYMWHNAGVEILDDKTLNSVIKDYREKDQAAYGGTTVENIDGATRMITLAKHISTLDAEALENIFGASARGVMRAIKLDVLGPFFVDQGEANLDLMFMKHGGVEGVLKMKEGPFASKIPKDSPHPVGHKDNPELIVLDLARLVMAGGDAADSVSEGVFITSW